MTLDQFLQSPVLLAIAGALVGGLRSGVMSWRKNGKARAVSDALIGVVFAVGMADWLTPPSYPKAAAVIGLLAGTTGARALDATAELMPSVVREFWRELVLGLARKITGSSGGRWPASSPGELPDPPYRGRFTRDEERGNEH